MRLLSPRFLSALLQLGVLSLFASAMARPDPLSHAVPAPDTGLRLSAPIQTWDEGIPLGNGTMGVLLWGETNRIRLSLDRGDLWDERPSQAFQKVRSRFTWAEMQRMVREQRAAEFNEVFDANYDYNGPPTKLPAGRLELVLAPDALLSEFELKLGPALGIARLSDQREIHAIVGADAVKAPVTLVQVPPYAFREVRLRSPDSVQKLGYPPAQPGDSERARWFLQPTVEGGSYAVYVGWREQDGAVLMGVTVATSREGKDPVAVARSRIDRALKDRWEIRYRRHSQWWTTFWEQSSVSLPDSHLQQHYDLVRYFYGAASRRGAPPMPLQGVWTADAGTLPPWKGDYHNDLNTQMTYMGYQAAGHFEEGAAFLDLMWELLPRFRDFARSFYQAPGAAVPGVMSLAGQPLGGWGQYSLSPTMGAWNAHLFYLHWRYTGDERFLRSRAYPWCREIGECLLHLLQKGPDGLLRLPLSSSPEIFDNTLRAFLKPNTNYDLMSLRMLFLALEEMARELRRQDEALGWRTAAHQLGPYHAKPDGTLLLDEQTELPGSHRHLSNLMGLYPFNLITVDGPSWDRESIAASLRQWEQAGTRAWCGYSFSWMAALRARVGDADGAVKHLDIYARAFTLRNGFHANGDQTKSGFSDMTYRPFTLEGNFLAMAAVHEMLLQSWSPISATVDSTPLAIDSIPSRVHASALDEIVLRVFPATPSTWSDVSFEDLRAEGGHRVSAIRKGGVTTWLRVVAGRAGTIRLRIAPSMPDLQWNRPIARHEGTDVRIHLRKGDVLEGIQPGPPRRP
ncbi:MAG: glycoside hydrolase N-terminal domain-containing protein [Verrucomicrobiales bacterium]|nr:glycoside hydrolase N-terminal domain-containing protein [Verrucomicrobiales bacterium]